MADSPFTIRSRLSGFSFGFSQEHATQVVAALEEDMVRLVQLPDDAPEKKRLGTIAIFSGVLQELAKEK